MEKIENKSIIKANRLIEAHYKLTTRELKFLEYAISKVEENDEPSQRYTIDIKDLKYLICPKEIKWGNIYKEFQDVLRSLKKKSLEIERPDIQEWWIISWIEGVKLHMGEGTVSFRFDLDLQPYLKELNKEKSTEYLLKYTLRLKSNFSIRIYTYLKEYDLKNENPYIELLEFKRMIGIEDKYKDFYDVKRRILEVAKLELAETTDIKFEYIPKKEGRKVVAIQFEIFSNIPKQIKNQDTHLFTELEKKETLEKELKKLGFENGEPLDILNNPDKYLSKETLAKFKNNKILYYNYLEDKILYCIDYAKNKEVRSVTGLFLSSIKNAYKNPKKEYLKKKQDQSKKINDRKLLEFKKKENEVFEDKYKKYIDKIADEYINKLNEIELNELEKNSIEQAKQQFGMLVQGRNDLNKENLFVRMVMRSKILGNKKYLSKKEFLVANKQDYKHIEISDLKK